MDIIPVQTPLRIYPCSEHLFFLQTSLNPARTPPIVPKLRSDISQRKLAVDAFVGRRERGVVGDMYSMEGRDSASRW